MEQERDYREPTISDPKLPEPTRPLSPRDLADVRYLIIHHTAGPLDETVLQMDRQHRQQGWAMIGYNYVVDGEGKIWSGRPDDAIPAAAAGLNAESINVVVAGQFEPSVKGYTGKPTAHQLKSLTNLAVYLHQKYSQMSSTISHRDVAQITHTPANATACPGQSLYDVLPDIRAAVWATIGH